MDERKRNIAVGLTTLLGVGGLLVLLMMFGYAPLVLERFYAVRIELPNAAGLHEGSRVNLSGIDVGQVRAIELVVSADPAGPVEFLPLDGSARIPGRIGSLASAFSQEIRAALAQPIQNFDRVSRDLGQLSDEWTEVGRNVNALLELRGVDAVDRGDAIANLSTVLVRTDARLAEMESVIAGVRAYVEDTEIREDVKATAANARRASERVAGAIDEVSGTFRDSVETLERRYIAVADDLSVAVASARDALDKVRAGQGTLGAVLNDPRLYEGLLDATRRTQAAIDRFLIQ